MAKTSTWVKASGWLFIIGILISVIAGLLPGTIPQVGTILLILGTIIGILGVIGLGSIYIKEADLFLLSVVALMAAGSGNLDQLPVIGQWVGPIVLYIRTLVVPAAVLIALKAIWQAGSTKF